MTARDYPDIQIVRARPDDAPALTAIAFAAKRHWGYPEHWIELWRSMLTITPRFITERETFLAMLDGRPIGFCSLTPGEGAVFLEHLWVLPERMGRGVGRALFVQAVEQATKSGAVTLRIESDPNAAGFYERMGARCTGVRVTEFQGQTRALPTFAFDLRFND